MYGIPGKCYGNNVTVNPGEIVELVKEAQMVNRPSRMFILNEDKRLNLTFDGMFLVDTVTGEIVDESRFDNYAVTTPILS